MDEDRAQELKAHLEARIEQLRRNPKQRAVFRVKTNQVADYLCHAHIRDFPPLVVDEPPVMGGTNQGPNPVELVLAALGTCQEIMYVAFAALMGIRLDGVEVSLRGQMDLKGMFAVDDAAPPGLERVEYETRLSSPEPPERVRALVEMVGRHCPVLDVLTRPVPVSGKVWLNGQSLDAGD